MLPPRFVMLPLLLAAMLVGQQPSAKPSAAAATTSESDAAIPAAPIDPLPPVAANARVVASSDNARPQSTQKESAATAIAAATTDRSNFTITAWDLELVLRPAAAGLAARAHVTVRNDAATARTIVPLQVSSSLQWQSARVNGTALPLTVQSLDTDMDHTGEASELLASLPTPLAAGASVRLDVFYEGTLPVDAARIEHLGAPRDMAQRTDWDRIGGDFTGLRGFGTVEWYPAIAEPATLGDGAKLFHQLGLFKLREQAATMRVRLRVDTSTELDSADAPAADAPHVIARTVPRVAMINSEQFDLVRGADGTLQAELPATPIGFAVPSLFLLSQGELGSTDLHMFPREANTNAAAGFVTALEQVRPLVAQWLGAQKRPLTVVDMPALQDAAFEAQPWFAATAGTPLLVTPMLAQNPQQNTLALAHALAHASFLSPRPWLSEGVAQFITTLWIGTRQTGNSGDPAAALGALEDQRAALTLAETTDPVADAGEPLIAASDDIYLHAKAAYVLWMLREMVGDVALADALENYRPGQDTTPEYFQHLLESASKRDLRWFFDDWVYRDRGLPDLKITGAISHKMDTTAPTWFVSVDISNLGHAACEVPVTIHAGDLNETQRVMVPARGSVTAHAVAHTQPTSVTVNDGATPEQGATVHQFSF